MELNARNPDIGLGTGEVVTLDDAAGIRIVARSGTVWVTEEGEAKDHVVGPGDAFTIAHNGRTVVQALREAWISLLEGKKPANDPDEPFRELRNRLARYY
ncbi:MAG: DUF2917 domain-containing protein [Bacillota bacterium]